MEVFIVVHFFDVVVDTTNNGGCESLVVVSKFESSSSGRSSSDSHDHSRQCSFSEEKAAVLPPFPCVNGLYARCDSSATVVSVVVIIIAIITDSRSVGDSRGTNFLIRNDESISTTP